MQKNYCIFILVYFLHDKTYLYQTLPKFANIQEINSAEFVEVVDANGQGSAAKKKKRKEKKKTITINSMQFSIL